MSATSQPAGERQLCSLMGQGREALRGVDAFGCLRSLRARSALDGVSWVQRGSVEIAVGQRLALATESAPSSAPSLVLLCHKLFGGMISIHA
jgi:hypothetical protein